jgi:hypothetical protein
MLCTRANSFHCPSTLCCPRSVKRLSRLLWRRLANTGSTDVLGLQRGLSLGGVGLTVHGSLHLLRLMPELGPGTAALLGGVAGQLDAVDGEHLAHDQALRVTAATTRGRTEHRPGERLPTRCWSSAFVRCTPSRMRPTAWRGCFVGREKVVMTAIHSWITERKVPATVGAAD